MSRPRETWFHGTSEKAWARAQKEGALHGERGAASRCTYLAADIDEARCYGPVVLRVKYRPGSGTDNYVPGCWQMRVYTAIPLDQVEQVEGPGISGKPSA